MNEYFDPYNYPDGRYSGEGLTLAKGGIAAYTTSKKLDARLFIHPDPKCTPKFDTPFLHKLGQSLEQQRGLGCSIIARGGHTVSLLQDGDLFWLLDSYNAYGAKDNDHLPLLKFLRNIFPNSVIRTSRDKIQNDYHNCSIFSIESALAIMTDMWHSGRNLDRFAREIDTKPEGYFPEDAKAGMYRELRVQPTITPACVAPFAQSLTLTDNITQNSREFSEIKHWLPGGSYRAQYAESLTYCHEKGKLINRNIQNKSDLFGEITGGEICTRSV